MVMWADGKGVVSPGQWRAMARLRSARLHQVGWSTPSSRGGISSGGSSPLPFENHPQQYATNRVDTIHAVRAKSRGKTDAPVSLEATSSPPTRAGEGIPAAS